MARLADHPYIVTVITAGVTSEADGSRPYLVLRYCPPPDLGVRVRSAPLSVPEALATGIKLASAIETAHGAGILHRDIKPSNVLMTTYGEPALTDFGIAGRIHEVDADREVRISYPWSSPELLDGRSNGSVASDVYSLGATIWNLLVGRSPFAQPQGDNSSRGLTVRILHAPPPLTQRRDVPPALDRLLQQCLAKDPAHRPASALELARGLQQIESQLGFARTAIAVEILGDSPTFAPPEQRAQDGDATIVKPISILPDSDLRAPGGPPSAAMAPLQVSPASRGNLHWLVAGAALLAAVILTVLLNGGAGDEPTVTDPTSTASHTPLPVEPAAPDPPAVTATRQGDRVEFNWRATENPLEGDSFEWKRDDTGESRRTTDLKLIVENADKVCLQVRLIRSAKATGWTQECV
jgi:serine/threonine protein kinase